MPENVRGIELSISVSTAELDRGLQKAASMTDRAADKMVKASERAAKRQEAATQRAAERAARDAEITAKASERAAERIARAAEHAANRQAAAAERAAKAAERSAEMMARRTTAEETRLALAAEAAADRRALAAKRAADQQIREAQRAASAAAKADQAYAKQAYAWHNQSFTERRGGGRGASGGAAFTRSIFAGLNIGQDFAAAGPSAVVNNLIQPQVWTDMAAAIPTAARALGRFSPHIIAATIALDGLGDSLHASGLGWGDFLSVVSETAQIQAATNAISGAAKAIDDTIGLSAAWDAFSSHAEFVMELAFGWTTAKDAAAEYNREAERAAAAEKAFRTASTKFIPQAVKDRQEQGDAFGQALSDAGGLKGLGGIMEILQRTNSEDLSKRLIADAIGGDRNRQNTLMDTLAAGGVDVSGMRLAAAGGVKGPMEAALGIRDDTRKANASGGEVGPATAPRAAEFAGALQERFDRSGGTMTVDDVRAALRAAGADERTIATSDIATREALSNSYNADVTARSLRDGVSPDMARRSIADDFVRQDAERADRARSEALDAATTARPGIATTANAEYMRGVASGLDPRHVGQVLTDNLTKTLTASGMGADQAKLAAEALAGEARADAERTITGQYEAGRDGMMQAKPRSPEIFDAAGLYNKVALAAAGGEQDKQLAALNKQNDLLNRLVKLTEENGGGGDIVLR
jgi:hypothetical protein